MQRTFSLRQLGRTGRKITLALLVAASATMLCAQQNAPGAELKPDWPVNNAPKEAGVTWNSHGLRIVASNSSLQQILKAVASATGMQVQGLTSDERIFGSYGPGPVNEVLLQLMAGSGYNVMMIGELAPGAPRQLILAARGAGKAAAAGANAADDDNDDTP